MTRAKNETKAQREKRLASQRRYRTKHADRVQAGNARYREENREILKQRQKLFYRDNKERRAEQQRIYRKRIIDMILEARAKPCVDCGIILPPEVMDFDHVRGKKEFNICRWEHFPVRKLGKSRIDAIKEEISKCEVRCSNCHRLRHFRERSGNYSSQSNDC